VARSALSRGFVASEQMLAIVGAAKMFGQRPAALMGIADPVVALGFDLAAAERLRQSIGDSDEPGVKRLDW
jgi:hypothetical protein